MKSISLNAFALLLALAGFSSLAQAAGKCESSVLTDLQAIEKYHNSFLKVEATATVKPGEPVWIRAEDFPTNLSVTTKALYVHSYYSGVLMSITAVLVDPATCKVMDVVNYEVYTDN